MTDPRKALSTARWQRLRRTIKDRDGWQVQPLSWGETVRGASHRTEALSGPDLIFESHESRNSFASPATTCITCTGRSSGNCKSGEPFNMKEISND